MANARRPTLFGQYGTAETSSTLKRLHWHTGGTLREVDHEPAVPVLDQEDLLEQGIRTSALIPGAPDVDALGSCVFNSAVEHVSTVLPAAKLAGLSIGQDTVTDEELAIRWYHTTTDLTGDPAQEWPPTDCGSSGQFVCQELENQGVISGSKVAALTPESILSLMQGNSLIVGGPWFEAWMEPGPDGFIDAGGIEAAIESGVAGGHETTWSAIEKLALTAIGTVNTKNTIIRGRNHWTKSWGDNGSYRLHLDTAIALGTHMDYRQMIA